MRNAVLVLAAVVSVGGCGQSNPIGGNGGTGGNGGGGGTDYTSLIVGNWLGPEPGFNQGQCSRGTTLYGFKSDGTFTANLVNLDTCGGSFTIGGTYVVSGNTLSLHFTQCPEGCTQFPDASETITSIDNNDITIHDPSFSGTYHRQT